MIHSSSSEWGKKKGLVFDSFLKRYQPYRADIAERKE
jgi:hypothetical protein